MVNAPLHSPLDVAENPWENDAQTADVPPLDATDTEDDDDDSDDDDSDDSDSG